MSSNSNLTCNFSVSSSLNIGVSFESANGGGNYGGQITVFTPATAGPVTTGLWDNDGNVFFTLYLTDNPDINCVINSGSEPGSWVPYVTLGQESGLSCEISSPQPDGENNYNYTLTVTPADAPRAAATATPTPRETAAGALYKFSVGLFDASAGSDGLQIWQSGTLTLDTSSSASLNGVLTLQGFYPEPIPFVATTAPVQEQAGITVTASGQTNEAQINLTLTYNFDGFLYNGSYIGGLVSILDTQAEETYLYVLQGLSPQGPFGAKDRTALTVDKRMPRSR